MRPIYRERNVVEQMDYVLEGDRPVSVFVLTQAEFEQFLSLGNYTKMKDAVEPEYYTYKHVRIVVE